MPRTPTDIIDTPTPSSASRIKRPSNRFIIWKNEWLKSMEGAEKVKGLRKESERIAVAGKYWKTHIAPFPDRVKVYQDRAEQEKKEHREKYPDYVFQPRRKKDSNGAAEEGTGPGMDSAPAGVPIPPSTAGSSSLPSAAPSPAPSFFSPSPSPPAYSAPYSPGASSQWTPPLAAPTPLRYHAPPQWDIPSTHQPSVALNQPQPTFPSNYHGYPSPQFPPVIPSFDDVSYSPAEFEAAKNWVVNWWLSAPPSVESIDMLRKMTLGSDPSSEVDRRAALVVYRAVCEVRDRRRAMFEPDFLEPGGMITESSEQFPSFA